MRLINLIYFKNILIVRLLKNTLLKMKIITEVGVVLKAHELKYNLIGNEHIVSSFVIKLLRHDCYINVDSINNYAVFFLIIGIFVIQQFLW